jgi:hypothetical protein
VGARQSDISYIQFRLAWCDLNSGKTLDALNMIIKAIKSADSNNQASFRKDLMKDYASILAKKDFTTKDVNQFVGLSTADEKDANLKNLGEESERLGNKKGALLIWTKYAASSGNENSKLAETSLKIAINSFDLGDKKATLKNLELTSQRIKNNECENCESARSSYRTFLISWNKKEKTEPSRQLTEAYRLYIEASPNDREAMIWAAQFTDMQKAHRDSAVFYAMAAEAELRANNRTSADQILVLAIEQAEKTGDANFKEAHLRSYANKMPNGHEINLVKYQIAYIEYKQGKYADVAPKFKALALNTDWTDKTLRVKSADLSLDSLALLNDRSQIISVCPVFAKAFPKERLRFNDIQRRAAVNNLTDALKTDGVSESDIRKHLQVLSQVPLEGATVKDKKLILKNLMLTGERLKDLVIVEKGARGLLGQQDLNAEEKEFARKSLLWVYELKLDFKNAYSVASQMQFPDLKPEQRHLKLALLAELTGKNPIEHYEAFLSSTKTTRAANEVRAKLIRMSKNKWAALERNLSFLKSTPEILASLTVEIYLQSPNIQKLDKISKIPKLSQTLEGQRLAKIYSLYSQQKELAEISRLRFTKNNDKAIQKSIKLRIAAFKKTRAIYESALRSNHLSLQALSLRVLAQENLRFGNEIQMLPAPRGLNKNHKQILR